jgi:hypothetical protein
MNDLVMAATKAMLTIGTPQQAEQALIAAEQPLVPLVHHFGPGIAIREITLQAGVLIVGHKQKYEHLCLLLEGEMLVKLEENEQPVYLASPALFTAKPGQKIMFAITGCVFQNIYATDLKDSASVEDHFIEKSEFWYENEYMRFAYDQMDKAADREDYFKFLVELGTTHEKFLRSFVDAEVKIIENGMTQMKPSPIEGIGLYATCPIMQGETIMPALVNGVRTQGGRYVNHSRLPNCKMVIKDNGDIDLVALETLYGCVGGNAGQELTVDYRHLFAFMKR